MRQYTRIVAWIQSPKGREAKEVLDLIVSVLLFLWLLKNHKIIKGGQ